jgi:hypothetical protein
MLNLAMGEPFALVLEMPRFDNLIKLKIMLASALDLYVHDLINRCIFHAIRVELCQCQMLCYL